MLALTRKPLERIRLTIGVNQYIWVTVVAIEKDHKRVRLGFEAPSHVAIEREEIIERFQKEQGAT